MDWYDYELYVCLWAKNNKLCDNRRGAYESPSRAVIDPRAGLWTPLNYMK